MRCCMPGKHERCFVSMQRLAEVLPFHGGAFALALGLRCCGADADLRDHGCCFYSTFVGWKLQHECEMGLLLWNLGMLRFLAAFKISAHATLLSDVWWAGCRQLPVETSVSWLAACIDVVLHTFKRCCRQFSYLSSVVHWLRLRFPS